MGAAAGEAPVYPNSPFFSVICDLKATFHFPSGHLASFWGSLMALLALRSQALWPVLVSVRNCYARQGKLIHFNGSCVFLFVRSAIAGCCCFLRRLNEISATLHHIGEPRLRAPPPPPDTFPQVGCVYFRAV